MKSYDPSTGQVEVHRTEANPRLATGADAISGLRVVELLVQRLDPATGTVSARSDSAPEETIRRPGLVAVTPDATLWVRASRDDLIGLTPTP